MSERKSRKSTKKSTKRSAKASKGLGDDIEKITKATGIKKAVEWFSETTGVDCGCEARKEKLNKLFPKRSKTLCLESGEYETLKQFFGQFDGRKVDEKYQEPLSRIHARVFTHKFAIPCSCSPKEWKALINDLKGVYTAYERD
jgi:hypothetical protein